MMIKNDAMNTPMIEDLPENISKPEARTSEMSASISTASLSTLAEDETVALVVRKSVSFGTVSVREYNRTVGDHPDVRVGPPVTLDWEFGDRTPLDVDEFENLKKRGLRRLSPITRKNMLKNVFGVSEDEIRLSEKEVQKILKSRDRSKRESPDGMKKNVRKIKRVFSAKNISKILAMAASPLSMPMMNPNLSNTF